MKHYSTYQSQFIEMFGDTPERVELSSLCETFIDGDWIEAKDQAEDGIRLIQTGNVGVGVFKDKGDKARYISEDTFERLNCTEVKNGDILVSRLPDPVGRACIIPEGLGKTITAVDCTIIRLVDKIVPKFFIAFTNTPDYAMQIKKVLSGTTRLRVSRANLGKMQVPLPAIQKQIEFVSIAEQADKSKFTSLKSQFIEMFSDVPKVGINTLVDTIWGSSPDSKTYNDTGEGVPFYQGKTEFGDLYINAPVTFCTAPVKMAKANAILMSVRAPVGAVNIATQDCCIGRGLASITPKEGKSTTMFIYYALKYMEEDIDRLGTGSTFKAINKESYAKIQMPNAEISDQTKFVSIAEQADKSKYIN